MIKPRILIIGVGIVLVALISTAAALASLPVSNVPGPMAPSSVVQPAASGLTVQNATDANIQASHNICLQECVRHD